MSAGKHTPGPWSVLKDIDKKTGELNGATIQDKEGNDLCILGYYKKPDSYMPYDEYFANAALIAAAPELLEALKTMVRIFGFPNSDCGNKNCDCDCHSQKDCSNYPCALKVVAHAIRKAEGGGQ